MLTSSEALFPYLAEWVATRGIRTQMSIPRQGEDRYYPYAIDRNGPMLPAGSAFLMGTPHGVAMQAPSALPLMLRGLVRFRRPTEQFRREELSRIAAGKPGGYLVPGDRVRASIDGLGRQIFEIREPGSPLPADPCAGG